MQTLIDALCLWFCKTFHQKRWKFLSEDKSLAYSDWWCDKCQSIRYKP